MTNSPRSDPSLQPPVNPSWGLLILAWLFVGLPLAWGVVQTLIKSMALFH
jgi:hypothetical protein